MNDTKSGLIVLSLSIVPYAAVAWIYSSFVGDGSQRGFWVALGALLAVRLFFSVIETFGGLLRWRLYQKRRTIASIVQVLRANKFPLKEYETDSFSMYLSRILQDYEPKPDVVRAAREFETMMTFTYELGVLPGMRYSAAADAAFDIYAPTAVESVSNEEENFDDGDSDSDSDEIE